MYTYMYEEKKWLRDTDLTFLQCGLFLNLLWKLKTRSKCYCVERNNVFLAPENYF
jgi:hypothetical protein